MHTIGPPVEELDELEEDAPPAPPPELDEEEALVVELVVPSCGVLEHAPDNTSMSATEPIAPKKRVG
jgi:hypothetical protein